MPFSCPVCRAQLEYPAWRAGTRERCTDCGNRITLGVLPSQALALPDEMQPEQARTTDAWSFLDESASLKPSTRAPAPQPCPGRPIAHESDNSTSPRPAVDAFSHRGAAPIAVETKVDEAEATAAAARDATAALMTSYAVAVTAAIYFIGACVLLCGGLLGYSFFILLAGCAFGCLIFFPYRNARSRIYAEALVAHRRRLIVERVAGNYPFFVPTKAVGFSSVASVCFFYFAKAMTRPGPYSMFSQDEGWWIVIGTLAAAIATGLLYLGSLFGYLRIASTTYAIVGLPLTVSLISLALIHR